jgi:hypothetical protein
MMRNWNTDLASFDKRTQKYRRWRLEQLVNFGLDGEKLDFSELKRYWPELDLEPRRKEFLRFLLWPNQS